MCIAGGKRCEYADAVTNVRKKAQYKFRNKDEYTRKDKVEEAVRQFQKDNPELVKSHMPKKMGFQYAPPKWSVPQTLLDTLGPKREPATGAQSKEEFDQKYKDLYEKRQEWEADASKDEWNAMHRYAMTNFEVVNGHLRGKGNKEWKKSLRGRYSESTQSYKEWAAEKVEPDIEAMDRVMENAEFSDEPQKVYRFFRVPNGIKPSEYIASYMQPGSGFKDKGYLSTSADPEYVASHVMHRSMANNESSHQYVVMEILTKRGVSLTPYEKPRSGQVQSLEAEILLPRNAGMRIIDSCKKKVVFGTDRKDLESQYRDRDGTRLDFSKGASKSFTMVRMIDEDLIRETRKQA